MELPPFYIDKLVSYKIISSRSISGVATVIIA